MRSQLLHLTVYCLMFAYLVNSGVDVSDTVHEEILSESIFADNMSDEEQIKLVLNNQTKAYFERDFNAWQKCFIHSPDLLWTVTNSNSPGDVITIRGWDDFQAKVKQWMKNPPSREPSQTESNRDQWNIQIRNSTAYVSFNDQIYDSSNESEVDATEIRVLEKEDGQWKIILLAALYDFKDAKPPQACKY